MAGKKNRITTTTTTNVQDRRIGAEGGSTIVSEGGRLTRNFTDNSRVDARQTEIFNLTDSDTAQASVQALKSVSQSAIDGASDTAESLFDRASDVFSEASGLVGRAFDLSEAAGASQQETAAAAIAKTASEGNQALETITRGAMVIAGAFLVAQIFRS